MMCNADVAFALQLRKKHGKFSEEISFTPETDFRNFNDSSTCSVLIYASNKCLHGYGRWKQMSGFKIGVPNTNH